MNKNVLVKFFGFPATMIHGDAQVLDRWLWLRKRLPCTANNERLLDVGCGSGAFTIGAARRGYFALGISFDERNNLVASERAAICRASRASFRLCDVRQLDTQHDLVEQFHVAICLETIEHILDDRKLICDIAKCLRPGGMLMLTTPYYLYRAITKSDNGPFPTVETGWHVRRGYTPAMLEELCHAAGLRVERISYCSGLLSQKITYLMRTVAKIDHRLGWLSVLFLRWLPPLLDRMITDLFQWPYSSICLEAYKPRYSDVRTNSFVPSPIASSSRARGALTDVYPRH
jgi:SAM-dependent methyltransferase